MSIDVVQPIAAGSAAAAGLSYTQERLWLVDAIEGAGALYNIPVPLCFSGRLETGALEAALGEVIRRHHALRTVFPARDGAPVPVVLPAWRVELPPEDLRMVPESVRQARLASRLEEEALRPFDLARGPLVRASLLRTADEEHLLLLVFHHIVVDGWSVGVLLRELATLYEACRNGEPSPLADPVQYADHARRQRDQAQGDRAERVVAYWRKQLAGAPTVLDLPTDRPRPAVQSHRGAVRHFDIDAALAGEVRLLARRERATPFLVLLAAFHVLLARYSGQEELVTGSVTSGRTRLQDEGVVGPFANPLVLCTDCSGNPAFRELLGRVRDVMLSAHEHQEIPFERLVEELRVERDPSRNPLFQVAFSAPTDLAAEVYSLPGLTFRALDIGTVTARFTRSTAKFDITAWTTNAGEGLRWFFEYATDLFDAATIDRMGEHCQVLLRAAVSAPERRLSELPLMDEAERRRLVHEWNATARACPAACVHELVAAQAARTPGAAALADADGEVAYAELEARANRLAHHLRHAGVAPEVRVGVCLEPGAELVTALLAVLKAGGAYVPLDPAYPAERLGQVLADSGAALVLATRESLGRLPAGAAARVVCLDAEAAAVAERPAHPPESGVHASTLAYVVYTSGSTGRPKGVAVTHGGVVNLALAQAGLFGCGPGERVLQFASTAFDASVSEIFVTLVSGGTLHLPRGARDVLAEGLGSALTEAGITSVTLPPAVLSSLPAGVRLPRLHTLVAAGEALAPGLVERYAGRADRMLNAYGPSEVTVCATVSRPLAPLAAGRVPIGRPIANTRVYVLDAGMRLVPVGVPGELFIAGAGVARGYLGRAALTAERFLPDPFSARGGERLYRSGDRVRWGADGELEFLGRLDDQVKLRGYRIEPGEVEAVLRTHPGVRECVVLVEDGAVERRLAAYVVPGGGESPGAATLRAYLADRLPEYMVPASLVVLERLPLTPSGKLDRRSLAAAGAGPGPGQAEKDAAPCTPTEALVCQVWAESLDLPRVQPDDNFFELGGHSLSATVVMSQIAEALPHLDLPLRILFDHPTVAALAEVIDEFTREMEGQEAERGGGVETPLAAARP
jgi:amino acid adenylation domain-containing protein